MMLKPEPSRSPNRSPATQRGRDYVVRLKNSTVQALNERKSLKLPSKNDNNPKVLDANPTYKIARSINFH